jgi:hypothetical protein
MFEQLSKKLSARSAALLSKIDNRLDRILLWWLVLAGLAAATRIALSPPQVAVAGVSTWTSYMVVVVAPFASTVLALRWFSDSHLQPQPNIRLARFSSWRTVDLATAERHPLYGAGGVMVSLLVGMMINVPLRTAEYLAAMPPLPEVAPRWLSALHFAMTFDVVLFGSLYMIAFVAALRRAPLFPRLLLAIWVGDLMMQMVTANVVVGSGPVPSAVSAPLQHLLEGNVKKVLISMGLWLPYLLLSTRVNVTYRHRVPA